MNIRNKIVKTLYPLCSDEVKILIDQMTEHPDRFYGKHGRFGMYESEYEWEGVVSGHFGLIDGIAVKLKNKDLRIQITKELILETLLNSSAPQEQDLNEFSLTSSIRKLVDQAPKTQRPTKILASHEQIEALKKYKADNAKWMKQQHSAHISAEAIKQELDKWRVKK